MTKNVRTSNEEVDLVAHAAHSHQRVAKVGRGCHRLQREVLFQHLPCLRSSGAPARKWRGNVRGRVEHCTVPQEQRRCEGVPFTMHNDGVASKDAVDAGREHIKSRGFGICTE
jgi:hypothetical protein